MFPIGQPCFCPAPVPWPGFPPWSREPGTSTVSRNATKHSTLNSRPTSPLQLVTAFTDQEAFLVRTWLIHLFRGFPQLDPELPDELAAVSQARARAAATFHELYEALADQAQHHFRAVVNGSTTGALGSS